MKDLILLLAFIIPLAGKANNIEVSNISLINQDQTLNTHVARFDLTWSNSWRTSTLESNWDAAWIVIKYREITSESWLHSSLQVGGSTMPSGVTADFAGTTGVFIHRDADGIGEFIANGVELQFSYGNTPDDAFLEICILAIEMVYIPENGFVVGDNSPAGAGNFQAGISTNPFPINSEAAITLGGTSETHLNVLNNANFPTDDFHSVLSQTLPSGFPKGYRGFYIMKYEISQQQYSDFLNKLPESAYVNRYSNTHMGLSGYQISDTGAPPNKFVTSTPDRACNFLSWADQAAYADWIGLRPMSELEYEKACRGVRSAIPDEFAWGSSYIANHSYTFVNQGLSTERISNIGVGTGNAIYSLTNDGNNQAWRCGIISYSALNKNRQETGGSYYGVMEMTGNLWECVITVGNAEGRQFTGIHGNGVINSSGNATTGTTWPNITLAPIADGTGLRGGSFSRPASDITISSRELANFDVAGRFSDVGGRLVRIVP